MYCESLPFADGNNLRKAFFVKTATGRMRITGNALKKIYNTAYFYYNIGRIKENHEQNRQLAQMIQEGGYGKSTGQKRQDTEQKGYHAEQNSNCAEQDGKGAGK